MSQPLSEILDEAIQDEYKARATYRLILETLGEVRPFANIVEAEQRHIDALQGLYNCYGIALPRDEWPSRISAPTTLLEACQAGVQAEIDNAAMYDRLLADSEGYPDVQAVLKNLQRASQENHLPAFERCVQRESRR